MTAINSRVLIRNNFNWPASFVLTHTFSDSPSQEMNFLDVPANSISTVSHTATGSTTSGKDHWSMVAAVHDPSNSKWENSDKRCTLEKDDENATIIMAVGPASWTLPLPSGGCGAGLTLTTDEIGVEVEIANSFSQDIHSVILTHKFDDETTETLNWGVISSGNVSAKQKVTGSRASGHDHWGITIVLADGTVWSKSDKRCTIETDDRNMVSTMIVKDDYWSIPLNSGGCTSGLSKT